MFNIYFPFNRFEYNLSNIDDILIESKKQIKEVLKNIDFEYDIKSFIENENPLYLDKIGFTITVKNKAEYDRIISEALTVIDYGTDENPKTIKYSIS